MYYESKYTNFTASEPPYTNIIYYKNINKTVVKIHIDNEWNMWGEVVDPFDKVIFPFKPIYRALNQQECEKLLMKDMPKPNRQDVLEKYNMKVMDYSMLLYSTRLINLINNIWVAWSEEDKAEDYHPRFNKELMKEREKTMIKLDYEPEDDEEPTPYCTDIQKERHWFYQEPSNELNLTNYVLTSKNKLITGENNGN